MVTTTHVPEKARLTSAVGAAPEAVRSGPSPLGPPLRRSARRLWVLGCLASAVWAGCFPIVSDLRPEQSWGLIACVGYLLAAAAAAFAPARFALRLTAGLALLGAVLVPLVVMLAQGWAQSEVQVVQYSATQLLHTGSPYRYWSSSRATGNAGQAVHLSAQARAITSPARSAWPRPA